jgi:nicotinamidase/pyrazinamidase
MKALIIVDIQNDFLPGGALAVADGDQVIPIVNKLIQQFDTVVATQDWHPSGHGSFASSHPGKKPGEVIDLRGLQQVLWPDHCVQGTNGAEFNTKLHQQHIQKVFQKGTDPEIDSYSGFFDNGKRKDTGLHDYLNSLGIKEVFVVGLATDYCVKFTALDATELGYKTTVVSDATRAVNLEKDDGAKALNEMQRNGVWIVDSGELL